MRNHAIPVICCCILAFAAATATAQSALEPGLIIIGGGSNAYAMFDIATSSDTSNTDINVYAWGGYTLEAGINIGPYIGISWDGAENDTDNSGSTSFSLNPGVQLSYYASVGPVFLFIRTIERLSFWTGSSTVSGTTTKYDFQLSGLSMQVDVGASFMITDYLLLDLGPELYYYMNLDGSYMRLEAGVALGLAVLL